MRAALLALWLAGATVPAVAADGDGESLSGAEADGAGQGLVLELDQGAGAPGTTDAAPPRAVALPDSEVELITGGGGKDGLAKRGRLKKEE